jgi:hypothetical protein
MKADQPPSLEHSLHALELSCDRALHDDAVI